MGKLRYFMLSSLALAQQLPQFLFFFHGLGMQTLEHRLGRFVIGMQLTQYPCHHHDSLYTLTLLHHTVDPPKHLHPSGQIARVDRGDHGGQMRGIVPFALTLAHHHHIERFHFLTSYGFRRQIQQLSNGAYPLPFGIS